MKLADYLHDNRETQREFAQRAGLDDSQVSRLVNGQFTAVKRELAQKIVKATGGKVTAADLLA